MTIRARPRQRDKGDERITRWSPVGQQEPASFPNARRDNRLQVQTEDHRPILRQIALVKHHDEHHNEKHGEKPVLHHRPPLAYSYRLTGEAARSNQRSKRKRGKNEHPQHGGGFLEGWTRQHFQDFTFCHRSFSGRIDLAERVNAKRPLAW